MIRLAQITKSYDTIRSGWLIYTRNLMDNKPHVLRIVLSRRNKKKITPSEYCNVTDHFWACVSHLHWISRTSGVPIMYSSEWAWTVTIATNSMPKDKPVHTRQPVRSTFLVGESRSQSLPSSAVASMPAESDVLGDGINGSAMAVPPPKAATSALRLDNTVKTTKGSPRKSMLLSKLNTPNYNTEQTKQVIDRSQELEDAMVFQSYPLAFLQSLYVCVLMY